MVTAWLLARMLTKVFVTQIVDSIVSHGCFLRDCSVEHSLIGLRSRLESGVEVKVSRALSPLIGILFPFPYDPTSMLFFALKSLLVLLLIAMVSLP